MTNPIQLLRDFRKWRKARYDNSLESVITDISYIQYPRAGSSNERLGFALGVRYGIEHREEILKQVKI